MRDSTSLSFGRFGPDKPSAGRSRAVNLRTPSSLEMLPSYGLASLEHIEIDTELIPALASCASNTGSAPDRSIVELFHALPPFLCPGGSLQFQIPIAKVTDAPPIDLYDILPLLGPSGFGSFSVHHSPQNLPGPATFVTAYKAQQTRVVADGYRVLVQPESLKVIVAAGGPTEERVGTEETTAAVLRALAEMGVSAIELDVGEEVELEKAIIEADLVFNCVHGLRGEDGWLARLCERHGVPITGPHSEVHEKCFDKVDFKQWASGLGARTPLAFNPDISPGPFIAKPRQSGGSLGVRLVRKEDAYPSIPPADMMYEEYTDGRNITCCVFPALVGIPLPVLEIHTGSPLYTTAQKRGEEPVTYRAFWPQGGEMEHEVRETSQMLYERLGASGPLRFDWLVPSDDSPSVLLECNSNPGLRPGGNCGLITSMAGITYPTLIRALLSSTLDASRTA